MVAGDETVGVVAVAGHGAGLYHDAEAGDGGVGGGVEGGEQGAGVSDGGHEDGTVRGHAHRAVLYRER